MAREVMTFKEWHRSMVAHRDVPFNGWHAAWSGFAEGQSDTKAVDIDLFDRWRLPDGKVQFISVSFETEEELTQIRQALKTVADDLKKEIDEQIDNLTFPT